MARTVVGIFDNETEARDAVQHLQREGISRTNIDLAFSNQFQNRNYERTDTPMHRTGTTQNQNWDNRQDISSQNQENNPEFNRSSTSTGAYSNPQNQQWNASDANRDRNQGQEDEGFFQKVGNFFSSLFENDNDAKRYTQASQNRTIVTVHTNVMTEAERAADIMDDCGAVDVDNQTDYERTTGEKNTGSAFGESNMNTGSRTRMSGASRRSRIFERPVEAENRLYSDSWTNDTEDYNSGNRKPII